MTMMAFCFNSKEVKVVTTVLIEYLLLTYGINTVSVKLCYSRYDCFQSGSSWALRFVDKFASLK